MTEAKRKADELIKKYDEIFMCERVASDSIIDCALLNVEEIINSFTFGYSLDNRNHWIGSDAIYFWQEVKEELNKMK